MSDAVTFPPLMQGEAVSAGLDPFAKACTQARLGCDAGTVFYALGADAMRAAIVFAPDVALAQAAVMLPLCAVGLQNALGALGPPELAVHLDCDGRVFVNGAACGGLSMAASHTDPAQVPDWLVVALHVPLWPETEDTGLTPDATALYAEGCADVAADRLLESWARHTLSQINRWESDGAGALHADWRALARDLGEVTQMGAHRGTFLGVDEDFGMLLRQEAGPTDLIPLTTLLREDI